MDLPRRFGTFIHKPASDKLLVAEAMLVVISVRSGLWMLPFRKLQDLLAFKVAANTPPSNPLVIPAATWAVRAASRMVPRATCLTQALSLQYLLRRRGIKTVLRLGVAHQEGEPFAAHAWVVYNGKVLIGGRVDQFTPLPDLKGQQA